MQAFGEHYVLFVLDIPKCMGLNCSSNGQCRLEYLKPKLLFVLHNVEQMAWSRKICTSSPDGFEK